MRLFEFLFVIYTITFVPDAVSAPDGPQSLASQCGDYLQILQIKPPHVEFVKCQSDNNRQGKPLRAIYRVAGIHAASAESFLARKAHLPRLRKSCCQWDSSSTPFTDKDGRVYSINMVSAETKIKSRKQWRNISSFEIVVETLTEDI